LAKLKCSKDELVQKFAPFFFSCRVDAGEMMDWRHPVTQKFCCKARNNRTRLGFSKKQRCKPQSRENLCKS